MEQLIAEARSFYPWEGRRLAPLHNTSWSLLMDKLRED